MLTHRSLGIILLRAALRGRVRLEYNVNETKADLQREFERRYTELTGERPRIGDGYRRQRAKWSDQYRVYLSLNGPERAYCLETGVKLTRSDHYRKNQFNYRTSTRRLFWDLVEAGFRLGDN